MIPPTTDVLALSVVVAHAGARPTPVPHWAVLIVGVLGIWVAIAGGVAALDRVLAE
ncbi:hypothetical protein [Halococcus salsus]|uniref:hypothetical protein n=1 Tax=Halococcus salsus TaxID=2162894 RepID=UPI001359448D|nr:hypothetical protein [Halococcus salsus]